MGGSAEPSEFDHAKDRVHPIGRWRPVCLAGQWSVPSAPPRVEGLTMPRGDKSSYTNKQKRQAEHIEEGYEERGVPEKEAERRAWATVNKVHGGGEKPGGGGFGKPENHEPMRKGGRSSH